MLNNAHLFVTCRRLKVVVKLCFRKAHTQLAGPCLENLSLYKTNKIE